MLSEEEQLVAEFEEQEKFYSDDVDNPSCDPWAEEQWAMKLERYSQVGAELEANGAEAAESKVCLLRFVFGVCDLTVFCFR